MHLVRPRRRVQDTAALVPPTALMIALVGFLAAGAARAFDPLWLPALTIVLGALFVGSVSARAQSALTMAGAYGCGFWMLWIVGRGSETGFGPTPELGQALIVFFAILAGLMLFAGLSRLLAGDEGAKKAISGVFLFILFAWLVAYFSGGAGGPDPLIRLLQERFGLTEATAESAAIAIRKTIHVVFYGLFAGAAFRAGRAAGWDARRAAGFGAAVVMAHAVYDETRQAFSPGRTGQWQDVLLDGLGVAIMLTLCLIFSARKESQRQ